MQGSGRSVIEGQQPLGRRLRRQQSAGDQDGQPDLDGRQEHGQEQLPAGLVALIGNQEHRERRDAEDDQEQEVQDRSDDDVARLRSATESGAEVSEETPDKALGGPAEEEHDSQHGRDE